MLDRTEVVVISRNSRHIDQVDSLRKGCAHVWIIRTAIARVPTGVDGQVHEVREPASVLRSVGLTARECPECIEVNWFKALRNEVRIQKLSVTKFVQRIARDVLRPVAVQSLQSFLIWILLARGNPPEFSILLPQIGLEQLRSSQETQDRGIS